MFSGLIERKMLVAGDISPDGTRILIRRGHNKGAWMYSRDPGTQTVEEVLLSNPSCDLGLELEEQGEAIAVKPDGEGFYTTSEGNKAPIYYYGFL